MCTNCRQPIPVNSTYCPFCGQLSPHASAVYSVYDSEATLGGNNTGRSVESFDQDLQETTKNSPPPAIPPVYGAAGVAIPFIPDGASRTTGRKRSRGRLMAGIAATLVVALILAAAGYTLYNVFAANAENASAQIVPAGTLAFASIDIVQYAENSHNFSINNLFQAGNQTPPDPLKQATGLDWQTDILPWVNRDIAFAAFSVPSSEASAQIGTAILIQSKDSSAAATAMKKAASFQQSRGHTINQSVYGGFTLYGVDTGGSPTFTAGSGWAIVASNAAAAKTIIDRINGKGDTLAGSPLYQSATSNLPSDHFGTIFVNFKALYALAESDSGSNSAVSQFMPFAYTYPTAGGFLEWTSSGLRAQMTLKASADLGIGNVQGNTLSLASLVPSNATLYAGIGNLGAEATAAAKISQAREASKSGSDPLQSLLGISSSNPVLQHPAALVVLGGSGAAASLPGEALYLVDPDASAAQALLQQFAGSHQLTLQPMTVSGTSATGIYGGSGVTVPYQQPVALRSCSSCTGLNTSLALVGVAAQINGTLVIGSSGNVLADIIATTKGGKSLAEESDFRQLTGNAPSGAATSLFVNFASLQASLGNLGKDGTLGQLLAHSTAMLMTNVVNNQESQNTIDLKVNL